MRKLTRNGTPQSRERARELRQSSGVSEQVFWELVRDRRLGGFKFRRQYPAGPYFLDFYCREASLAIELDGEQHLQKQDYDLQRDEWLSTRGILVLRIPTRDLFAADSPVWAHWRQRIVELLEERAALAP